MTHEPPCSDLLAMMQLPVKKKHPRRQEPGPPASLEFCVHFPEVVLCLVEKRMGASRKAFLTTLARQRGFCVEDANSERVTHVVSEGNSGDEVVEWLKKKGRHYIDAVADCPALLNISWFTESMSAERPVPIEPRHYLLVTAHAEELEAKCQVAPYACQRRTLLLHSNQALVNKGTECHPGFHHFYLTLLLCLEKQPDTHKKSRRSMEDALQTMAEEAHFNGSEARSLAFSRAASVLKSLPWTVKRVQELHSLPCIGEHSRRIVQEVLEDGASAEVERVQHSERYQAMKLFTKIFGVGVKTASRWYQEGLRTLADLQVHHAKLSKEQQVGLLHYDDLNTPVERSEAEAIGQVVREAVEQCLPGASVTLTGGFRRGKPTGHDVDFLVTHPTEGQEVGLLSKVISWLDKQGCLLYYSSHRNTFLDLEDLELWSSSSSASMMDRFERCFSIFCLGCLPGALQRGAGAQKPSTATWSPGASRSWKAVRVDLVVSPYSQFPFALLGWTGSRNFERDLRRFSKHEKKMALNSHTLYHVEQKIFLTAASEEEIFQLLGLEYIPPEERNA
ncbi:DNA-directed DNA/RNA polymerase mu isoform X2 [Rhineura floridana]|uniref:DNA-directed DNA/RNA polymerase mu isoform X2 n=1 Tax=Rhineura floridana TaxID=261503 RepID=UPI002AC81B52|nr:DNA-directed DNA/RNA polymerase mu isoform X2 [Rhineura floridana]